MAVITLWEILDIIIMTLFVGFLFSGSFGRVFRKKYEDDPVAYFERAKKSILPPEMVTAMIVAAPALIAHELAHKFTAMAMGATATFHAFYADSFTLILGVIALIAKLTNFGIFFVVPGFVSICEGAAQCLITPLQGSMIAFAGPFLNLVLWITAWSLVRLGKFQGHTKILVFTSQVNMFLFFFNMIPIGPFDGGSVLKGILAAFG